MLLQCVLLKLPMLLCLILAIVSTASTVKGLNSRKLDDNTITVPITDSPGGQKCSPGCGQNPSPPYPPPPSPRPPPSPKKPPSQYCPPPPPSSSIYMTGPPGQLYPIDTDFNGSCRSLATSLSLLIACGLLGLLVFW